MRAIVLTATGGPEKLQVQERPDPQPGPGQVAIDVAAAGVNFADTMARVGVYPDAPKTPCVLGYEVAGTVAEVGEGVTVPATGDRVMAGTRFGGYASRVVVDAEHAVALPDSIGLEAAAAIPVNYSTAWAGLMTLRQPAARRAGAAARGRRRGRHRGHPGRQARGRRGARHRVAGQARRDPRLRRRRGPRLHPRWLGEGAAALRPDHGRGGRRLARSAPTRCCAPAAASWPSAPHR